MRRANLATFALLLAWAILGTAMVSMMGCANLTAPIAKANDDILLASETVICRGISVGAWVRAYGTDPAKAAAWKTLCNQPIDSTPAAPAPVTTAALNAAPAGSILTIPSTTQASPAAPPAAPAKATQ